MRIDFTDVALDNLEDRLLFLIEKQKVPLLKVEEIRASLFSRAYMLVNFPNIGQVEEELSQKTGIVHRRIIEGYFKIIYTIDHDIIHVTDFFDSREDPKKMKG